MSTTKTQFLAGFARGLGIDDINTASAHWDAFSRNLSDTARAADEAQGFDRGQELGTECRKLDGAPNPESFVITGRTMELLTAISSMSKQEPGVVLHEWLHGALDAEVDDCMARGDAEALLIGVEADPTFVLSVVTETGPDGRAVSVREVSLPEARQLLAANPTVCFQARRPFTPSTAEVA